jgi:hypothetical protein
MPAEAVKLDLHVDGLDPDDIDDIEQTVAKLGFQSDPHSEPMMNGVINFQPFENTEENRELVEKCATRLKEDFPDLNVRYEIGENRDPGILASQYCNIIVEPESESKASGDSSDPTEDSDSPDWRAFGDDDAREKKRVGSSYTQSTDTSTDFDDGVEPQEADGASGPPDNCIECDSEDIETVSDEADQFICSNCGLVMKKRRTKMNSPFFDDEERSDYIRADWAEQTETAIVGIITDPERRHHEYYRIENPREFFHNCSGEREQKQKIKRSDIEPFETLDLPRIDWKFTD